MDFAVHRELTGLAEGAIAPRILALERPLLSVDVHVLLQVLPQSELLEADYTNMLFVLRVGCHVASEREARGVRLVAAVNFTGVGVFHE